MSESLHIQPDGTRFVTYADKDELILVLHEWAQVHPKITKVIVYGSRARGEHKPNSDLDVAVELLHTLDETACAVWMYEQDNWRNELAPLLPWPLHLEWHDLEGSTPVVRGKIEQGHLVVFCRNP